MLQVRKANERGYADHGWLKANHTFSFAGYYDPAHIHFSHLRVINEDFVAPTMGFGTHPHDNMEILTYVLEGRIAHKDSMGNVKEFNAGEFQFMSAGSGVTHSEFNPSNDEMLHLYQIWIIPNVKDNAPRYDQRRFADEEGATLILSPTGEGESFRAYQDMKLWRYQYKADQTIDISLNSARNYWLQVVKGELKVNDIALSSSDAVGIRAEERAKIETSSDVEFLLFDLK
ncbi:pirin family protein [Exercitatus varius]|uniref:pirin family protein n=1 Tax=Exercitatus varius TaxID=67857 RepID=UPI00294B2881|nr:pirin family protein [Exercitatus varius]MDG2957787.1 pirin family protein [Exercitatus varius]